jgi:FkbM family methyltransferase
VSLLARLRDALAVRLADRRLSEILRGVAIAAGRRLRLLVFSTYYVLVGLNHRYELVAPRKRVDGATFRSYELVNKHGGDRLLTALCRRVEPGDVVVDAGANTGVYALAVAATRPDARVVAFEPSPTVVEQCRTNVRLNGFGDRIDVRGVGLGSEAGEATFYRSTYDELGSFNAGNAGAWEASVADTVAVPVATVDGLVADGDVPAPDHLKVDVEGFEYEVLVGARETLRRHRPAVYLEVHDVPDADGTRADHEAALANLLRDCGYRIRRRDSEWHCLPREETEPGEPVDIDLAGTDSVTAASDGS